MIRLHSARRMAPFVLAPQRAELVARGRQLFDQLVDAGTAVAARVPDRRVGEPALAR